MAPLALPLLAQLSTESADWGEVLRILTLRGGINAASVTLGTTFLGAAAGGVGAFALLRRRALMGDALAHATLPGVAGAFIVAVALGAEGRSLPVLLLGAAVSGALGVLCVQGITRYSRLHEDAAIGAVLSVFFALGIVLLSYIQTMRSGTQGGLSHFIMGQTAAMRRQDALLMGGVAIACALACALLFKEFRAVCFDRDHAAAQGWPVGLVDLAMMGLVVVVTVIGLQAVGLLLIVAMLIIPAAAARFWTDRLGRMTLLAGALGAVSGYLGASASAIWHRLPAGGVIVLVSGAVFLVSFLAAPRRGVVAAGLRRVRLRFDIAADHALRLMYESIERRGRGARDASIADLAGARTWSRAGVGAALRLLAMRGMVTLSGGRAALTDRGMVEARRVTRNHRLWEQFLVSYAELAPSHVDRAADMVEHVLSPELVARLEAELAARGALPHDTPPSVHPIEPAPGRGGGA